MAHVKVSVTVLHEEDTNTESIHYMKINIFIDRVFEQISNESNKEGVVTSLKCFEKFGT
jgi:hypothetical protein